MTVLDFTIFIDCIINTNIGGHISEMFSIEFKVFNL